MIEQAKQVAQRLRVIPLACVDLDIVSNTIDALCAEVERLTKVDVEPVAWLHHFKKIGGGRRYEQADIGENLEPDVGFERTHKEPLYPASALAALQQEVERLTPLQYRQAPCHTHCEATAFNIEIRNLKAEIEMLKAEKMLDYTSLYDKYGDALAEVQELHAKLEQAQAVGFKEGASHMHQQMQAQLEVAQADSARIREALEKAADALSLVWKYTDLLIDYASTVAEYEPNEVDTKVKAAIDAARAALGDKT